MLSDLMNSRIGSSTRR